MSSDYLKVLPSLKFRTTIAMGKTLKSMVPMIFEVSNIEEVVYEGLPLPKKQKTKCSEDVLLASFTWYDNLGLNREVYKVRHGSSPPKKLKTYYLLLKLIRSHMAQPTTVT